ncbi:MAG: GNAT family N-acetyltransferase [Lachnospiraceae bacterium]|nr:GNAT family N-acetyltransferase [Lachnospiraceae bacterium]
MIKEKANFVWVKGETYKARIYDFLAEIDDVMIPPLRGRVVLADYAEKLAGKAETVFMVKEATDLASCSIYCNEKNAFITSIAVKKEYQKQHLGSQLLNEVKKFVEKKECERIRLEVFKENISAYKFYLKNRFEVINENDFWITMEYRMEEMK